MKWEKTFKMKKYFFVIIILFTLLNLYGCANQKALSPKNIDIDDSLTIVIKNEKSVDEVIEEPKKTQEDKEEIIPPLEPPSNKENIEENIDPEQKKPDDSFVEQIPEEKHDMIINIQVGSQTFLANLVENDATKAFIAQLPLTLTMEDLNRNEKYYYLESPLPQNVQTISEIKKGDLMLFGNDCLVLFYEDFSTSYSYTRIGKIEDISGLKEALGSGHVDVTFSKNE